MCMWSLGPFSLNEPGQHEPVDTNRPLSRLEKPQKRPPTGPKPKPKAQNRPEALQYGLEARKPQNLSPSSLRIIVPMRLA